MNFLKRNRQSKTDPAYNTTTTGNAGSMPMRTSGEHRRDRSHSLKKSEKRERKQQKAMFDINSGNFNRRPSFGQW